MVTTEGLVKPNMPLFATEVFSDEIESFEELVRERTKNKGKRARVVKRNQDERPERWSRLQHGPGHRPKWAVPERCKMILKRGIEYEREQFESWQEMLLADAMLQMQILSEEEHAWRQYGRELKQAEFCEKEFKHEECERAWRENEQMKAFFDSAETKNFFELMKEGCSYEQFAGILYEKVVKGW